MKPKKYNTLQEMVDDLNNKYSNHIIKPKTNIKGFEQHYQYIKTLDDIQEKYLEAIKLTYEIVMQHPLIDGNKRLSYMVLIDLLGDKWWETLEKLGE